MEIGLIDKYGNPIVKGDLVRVLLGEIDIKTGKVDPTTVREKIYNIAYNKSKAAFAFTTDPVDNTDNSIPICEFLGNMTVIISIEVLPYAV